MLNQSKTGMHKNNYNIKVIKLVCVEDELCFFYLEVIKVTSFNKVKSPYLQSRSTNILRCM